MVDVRLRGRPALHAVLAAACLGVAALLFRAAFLFLGPDSLLLPPFNSDAAVPVLMSNEAHPWDVFHAFFFGQDRFGAWPFLLAHALGGLLQRPVTPEFLHRLATLFLLAGAVPAMLLCRPFLGPGLLAYAIALVVPESRGFLFELGQVYPWQIPLLFWGWWSIRCSFVAEGRRLWGWLALLTCLACLASWTAVLSGPLLLGLTLLEGQRAEARLGAHPGRRWLLALLPVALGSGFEALLRTLYNRFVQAHYQRSFHTSLRLDTGHVWANAQMVWLRLQSPAVAGALLVLAVCAGLLLVRARTLRGFRPGGLDCTVLGALLLALLPLPFLALVAHVRLNDYSPRYFAPTGVFALFGGLLALAVWLPSAWRGWPRSAALVVGTLALCVLGCLVRPTEGQNPDYARLRETARRLAEGAPRAVLLDGYWGTYLFAALAPPGALLPLPRAGEWNRLPALEEALPHAARVVVGHRGFLGQQESAAPAWLFQYGTLLEREEETFLFDGVDRFSAYRPRAVEALAAEVEPPPAGLRLEHGRLDVTVRAASAHKDTVLAVELGCLGLSRLPVAWAEGQGGERVAVQVEPVPGALFFLPEAGASVAVLHLSFEADACRLRGARWFLRPSTPR